MVPMLLEIKIISSYSEKGTFSNWGSVLFIASFMIGSSSAGVRPWKVMDVLAVVKADDFITTFSSHGSSIIEKGLGAGITDTWENDGKFFHVGTSLEIVN